MDKEPDIIELKNANEYEKASEPHINAIIFNELKSVNSKLTEICVTQAEQQKDIDYLRDTNNQTLKRLEPIAAHNAQICFIFKLGAAIGSVITAVWALTQIIEFIINHI